MARNLHTKPFDDATNVKLSLFREYIKGWLPVFIAKNNPIWKTINIFDFFAGPGKTDHGDECSPIIVIDEVKKYISDIRSKSLNVNLYFNEYDENKYQQLLKNLPKLDFCKVETDNLDFSKALDKCIPRMRKSANLLLLDQSGVKQIHEDVLKKIISIDATDFIMFISSSTLRRFSEHPSIKKYIKIDHAEMTTSEYVNTHKLVTDHFRTLIPSNRKFYLAPFSIKKGANIYGLIFGTSHLKGLKQFLAACWKIDPERGEANFDIDGDQIDPNAPYLFPDMNKPKKVNVFERKFEQLLQGGRFQSKAQIQEFALLSGFLPRHTTSIVRKYEKDAKIKLN